MMMTMMIMMMITYDKATQMRQRRCSHRPIQIDTWHNHMHTRPHLQHTRTHATKERLSHTLDDYRAFILEINKLY